MLIFAMRSLICSIIFGVAYLSCNQKCTGSPIMCKGKQCATVTRYTNYHKGACECGHGDSQFGWNHDHFVTAHNQMFFDEGYGGGCGQRCGECVKLTTTGVWVWGQGGTSPTGQSQVFYGNQPVS